MTINELVKKIHENAKAHGWWDGEERSFGELIALCHSELSEALEEHRGGLAPRTRYYSCPSRDSGLLCADRFDGCQYGKNAGCAKRKPEGVPSELADCVIRIMDICGHYGIDLEDVIVEKHEYNKTRPLQRTAPGTLTRIIPHPCRLGKGDL